MAEGEVTISLARCSPTTTFGGASIFNTGFSGLGNAGLGGSTSFTDGNGQFTLAQLNQFADEFVTSTVASTTGNALSDAVNTYGSDAFYTAVDTVSDFIINNPNTSEYISSAVNFEDYEVLFNKIEMASPITPFEMAEFIDEYNYTPETIVDEINDNPNDLIDNWASFFNGSFANSVLGGFCAKAPFIFAAIGGFFNLIGSIEGAIKDAITFLNKIKNIEDPIKAIFEKIKVKALIEGIKEKLVGMIEKTIKKVTNIVQNFSLENVMGQVETFIDNTIVRNFMKLKDSVSRTFSEENIKNLLDKIKQTVDYGVSLFENPSLEEIQFLIARFCGMAALIEQILEDRKLPLQQFVSKYQNVYATVKARSNINTSKAINAGRPVLSPEKRQELINTYKPKWELGKNLRQPTIAEYEAIPSFQSLVDDANGKVYVSKSASQWVEFMGEEGWEGIDINVRLILMRTQERFGEKLYINSGKRSVQYQDLLRSQSKAAGNSPGQKGDYGVAYTSQHLDGFAIDTHWRSYPRNLQDFVDIAEEEGFTGIGLYNDFIHIDVGPRRVWDKR